MASVEATGETTTEWIAAQPVIAVPVFQRDYRWSVESCHQLLRDIRAISAQDDEQQRHFIGSILASTDETGGLTLVDGQQRVTTLMLMMAALRDHARSSNDPLADEIASVLVDPLDSTRSRLRPHDQHREVVQGLMTGATGSSGDSTFERNYQFFAGELVDDWREVWRGLGRVEHVAITLSETAKAQQIFESLNSTGVRLTDDELIHNYIHMGRSREAQDTLEREVWLPIEQATNGATSAFWRDYLVATARRQPDMDGEFGIYRAFAARYPEASRDLPPAVTEEWVRSARLYEVLLNPTLEADPQVREQLELLAMFEGGPRPITLAIYADLTGGRIDKATFLESAERLQSMWIRSAIVGRSIGLRTAGTVCREIRETGYPLDSLVARTPEDQSVRLRLTYAPAPNMGYVLRRLQKPPSVAEKLQIEHIYPQTPHDSWSGRPHGATWGELSTEEQAKYRTVLNTLGNLTLLEAPLNQSAGNKSFPDKARDDYPRSLVPETRGLASRDGWDYSAITERTTELVEAFLRTWPRPAGIPAGAQEDLVRIVDFAVPPGMADPEVFEYVTFEDQRWDDVRNVRQLLARVVYLLSSRDSEKLASTPLGGLIHPTRTPWTKYVVLPDGQLLYAAWATRYLLEAVQETLSAFQLQDVARAKLIEIL